MSRTARNTAAATLRALGFTVEIISGGYLAGSPRIIARNGNESVDAAYNAVCEAIGCYPEWLVGDEGLIIWT